MAMSIRKEAVNLVYKWLGCAYPDNRKNFLKQVYLYIAEWNNSNMFLKEMEENNELFGQLGLNGSSGNNDENSVSTSNFMANPWADQDAVQLDPTYRPFEGFPESFFFGNRTLTDGSTEAGNNSDNWAKFDQPFTSDSDNSNFADFSNAPDIFSTAAEPALLTTNSVVSNVTDHVSTTEEESKKPDQL